jgi:hypothetical protein
MESELSYEVEIIKLNSGHQYTSASYQIHGRQRSPHLELHVPPFVIQVMISHLVLQISSLERNHCCKTIHLSLVILVLSNVVGVGIQEVLGSLDHLQAFLDA